MEKELKILAELDKRIEKTMVRLVSLKEYKRVYGTKEVKAKPAEAISLPAKQPGADSDQIEFYPAVRR